jgi:hypothetical protein
LKNSLEPPRVDFIKKSTLQDRAGATLADEARCRRHPIQVENPR